jgi:tetratricopeptide (TPR) repeat protein
MISSRATGWTRWVVAAALAVSSVAAHAPPAAAQSDQDEESQLLVEEARRALGKKNYARAGSLLDRALQTSPRRLDLYILRASIHGIVGEHPAAVALLERARRLAPDNAGVLTALGIQLVQAGRAGDGVPLLEKMVAADPRRYDAQVVLGQQYLKQGAYAEGARAFDAYFAHRPKALAGEDQIHRLDHAAAKLRSGDAAGARDLYKRVLEALPRDEMGRLGVAWSTAAISCKKAMPIFDGIADLETKYAEVSLVRGRCALLLERLDEALARAERYRKAAPDSVLGWLLLGDVRIAQRNWKEAEAAFQRAIEQQPGDPLVSLKLGRGERMIGKVAAAAERLRAAGPPVNFEDDWTLEYGEALLSLREAAPLRDHMAPWVKAHDGSATGHYLLGSALYALGDHAEAVPHLDRGMQGGEPRSARILVDVLNTLAVAAVKKKELEEAVRLLVQADAAGGGVLTARNLGAVLIQLGDHERAIMVLKKSGGDDAVALHVLARAYHGAKHWDEARATYARAVKAYGKDPRVVDAHRDLANAELAAGRGDEAVGALTAAIAAAPAAARKELEAARLIAARSAATDAMRTGRFSSAVRVLRGVEKSADGEVLVQLRCDLALAATGATQRELALDLLKVLERSKARCPFVAPADDLGVPILIAWNEGATLRRAKKALSRLDALRRKATGVAEPLVRQAAGDIALRAAAEAYSGGATRSAATYLSMARVHDRRSPELAHNLAVIAITSGSVDDAISVLTGLANDVPEARINLGIAWEKKGEPLKALAAWKAALAAGARHSQLRDWIQTKERFWGSP